MEGIEKIYVVSFPYQKAYNARKKRASRNKKKERISPKTMIEKIENLLKLQEIIDIYVGHAEDKDFLRDALLIFRIKTFGMIGALLLGFLFGAVTYFLKTFTFSDVLFAAIAGGLCCAYFGARITLLHDKPGEFEYLSPKGQLL